MSTTQQGTHSLAFRVMRLCKPSFHVKPPFRLDPSDLFVGEDIFDDPLAASNLPPLLSSHVSKSTYSYDLTYGNRFLLHHPSNAMGFSGLLVLPQSFGAIYLGETFCSYISINNSSNFEVRDVIIKAEIQTERQRILLLDTSKSSVESIRASGHYDFLWNMMSRNLELIRWFALHCTMMVMENENIFHSFSSSLLRTHYQLGQRSALSREIFKPPILVRSGGGIHNYLYQLKLSSTGSAQVKVEGTNILGKFQITWRTNLGEPGRLQTQQILGTPISHKEIELQVLEIPSPINLDRPFSVHLNLTNHTDRELGPFEIWLSQSSALEEKIVMINGLQTMALLQLEAFNSTDFHLNLIATKLGVQRISGITVSDTREKKTIVPLPDLEIFVESD
ncbi:hypothetical protein CRYUN_Cryun32bG0037600 [Craigia yunnanensis]